MLCHYSALLVSVVSKFDIKDFDQALGSVLVLLVSYEHEVLGFVVLELLHMYTLINTCNGSSEV